MNRRTPVYILLCFCLILQTFVSGAPHFVGQAQALGLENDAVLESVEGEVWLQRSGGLREFEAQNNTALYRGDRVRTGQSSSATVVFDEESSTTLGEYSSVIIANLEKGEESIQSTIKVAAGQVWNKTKRLLNINDQHQVETPTAVMGVRGTLFLVSVDDENTDLSVFDGNVAISAVRDSSEEETDVGINEQNRVHQDDESTSDNEEMETDRLIEETDGVIIGEMITDMTEASDENIQDTEEGLGTYEESSDMDDMLRSFTSISRSNGVIDLLERILNDVSVSDRLEEIEERLSRKNTNMNEVRERLESNRSNIQQQTEKLVQLAEERGIALEDVQSSLQQNNINVDVSGSAPASPGGTTPEGGGTPPPPTLPSPGGGGAGDPGAGDATDEDSEAEEIEPDSLTFFESSSSTDAISVQFGYNHQSLLEFVLYLNGQELSRHPSSGSGQYVFDGLELNESYTIRIDAVDENGTVLASHETTVTTELPEPQNLDQFSLSAVANTISVNFAYTHEGLAEYILYLDGVEQTRQSGSGAYTFESLDWEESYTVRVEAVNQGGIVLAEAEGSTTTEAFVPGDLDQFSLSAVENTISVDYGYEHGDLDTFILYLDGQQQTSLTISGTHIIENLLWNESYTARVEAVSIEGQVLAYNEGSIQTEVLPPPPPEPAFELDVSINWVDEGEDVGIWLDWNHQEGMTYKIELQDYDLDLMTPASVNGVNLFDFQLEPEFEPEWGTLKTIEIDDYSGEINLLDIVEFSYYLDGYPVDPGLGTDAVLKITAFDGPVEQGQVLDEKTVEIFNRDMMSIEVLNEVMDEPIVFKVTLDEEVEGVHPFLLGELGGLLEMGESYGYLNVLVDGEPVSPANVSYGYDEQIAALFTLNEGGDGPLIIGEEYEITVEFWVVDFFSESVSMVSSIEKTMQATSFYVGIDRETEYSLIWNEYTDATHYEVVLIDDSEYGTSDPLEITSDPAWEGMGYDYAVSLRAEFQGDLPWMGLDAVAQVTAFDGEAELDSYEVDLFDSEIVSDLNYDQTGQTQIIGNYVQLDWEAHAATDVYFILVNEELYSTVNTDHVLELELFNASYEISIRGYSDVFGLVAKETFTITTGEASELNGVIENFQATWVPDDPMNPYGDGVVEFSWDPYDYPGVYYSLHVYESIYSYELGDRTEIVTGITGAETVLDAVYQSYPYVRYEISAHYDWIPFSIAGAQSDIITGIVSTSAIREDED